MELVHDLYPPNSHAMNPIVKLLKDSIRMSQVNGRGNLKREKNPYDIEKKWNPLVLCLLIRVGCWASTHVRV